MTSSPGAVIAACAAAVALTVFVVWGAQERTGHGRLDAATFDAGQDIEHPAGAAAVRGRVRWLANQSDE